MALVEDAGTTVESRKASSRMVSHTVTAERFLQTAAFLKACGKKVGEKGKDKKLPEMVSNELETGTITTTYNEI